ncbi:hypothetical protein [Pantanalinema sp. GBBB05]|uniref:spermine/spermidine synthase domain-containing protein n=1 Tax=Pantanalinema sp. GBBB05 TaxID=2604139 RepID=UPI001DFC28DA|nr:spermine synthase [Pantanalinema sp. GBBB05]
MPTLFIEQHSQGLAFYINGNLQFDTTDEAIYHEHLVVPAISLAEQRFPNLPLRVLICGGGDGLAARDVLRFNQVREITLVDYDPDVLELGRTVFQPYNQGSLTTADQSPLGSDRVTVYTQEAFEFVSNLPDACYHVVICDFTCPTRPEETQVYSLEWLTEIRRILAPQGVLAKNAVSPQQTPAAFWCLYQTALAAGIHTKPMRVVIPSFHHHDYGDWGFLLGSPTAIAPEELTSLKFPNNLQVLQVATWIDVFRFPATMANDRHLINLHTLDCPQLFYYLLNSHFSDREIDATVKPIESEDWLDFLAIQESGTGLIGTHDPLEFESMIQVWLDHFHPSQSGSTSVPAPASLIPVQHPYHDPRISQEWLGYTKALLSEIDAKQLLSKLVDRAQELPPQLAKDLKQLLEKVRSGQPLTYISEHTAELITILSVSLLVANLAAPDAAFAKGFSGSSYRSGYSSGSSSSGDYYYSDGSFGWLGFWMTMIGGMWLWNLYKNRDD